MTGVLSLAFAGAVTAGPVKIIFDTDMICDFDDVGALACLHALADAGECEILATVSSTRGNASVAAIEVVNGYYGRPEIPVGAPKDIGVLGERTGATAKVDPQSPLGEKPKGFLSHWKYRKLALDYPQWVRHLDADDAPDALEVYRQVLARQEDRSVVICSVGFLTNLRRLVEECPKLVEQKVCKWVAMACNYPRGKEYNSLGDPVSSRIALEKWPTPVVFSDFQYGMDVFADGASPMRMKGGIPLPTSSGATCLRLRKLPRIPPGGSATISALAAVRPGTRRPFLSPCAEKRPTATFIAAPIACWAIRARTSGCRTRRTVRMFA